MQVQHAISDTFSCPADAIHARHVDGPLWQVNVCGTYSDFLCWRSRSVGFRCVPESSALARVLYSGGQVPASPPPPEPPTAPRVAPRPPPAAVSQGGPHAWTARIADALFQAIAAPVRTCVPPPAPLELTLDLDHDGRVVGVGGLEDLTVDQQICVATAVQGADVPGGLARSERARFTFR